MCLQEFAEIKTPLHLALGVFDGVHIGHQAVISEAIAAARAAGEASGVLTFDPHPIRVLAPEKAPAALLSSLAHKARLVRELGAERFIALHFDAALAALDATEFLDLL